MSKLERLSVSLERSLLAKLEALVKESGYRNRSEYIRDLIREKLVQRKWDKDEIVVGTVTLVYDHHVRQLSEKLTSLQHEHHDEILATTHVHLSHDMCVEMILVRGRAGRVKEIADKLGQQKGVMHTELSMSTAGEELK